MQVPSPWPRRLSKDDGATSARSAAVPHTSSTVAPPTSLLASPVKEEDILGVCHHLIDRAKGSGMWTRATLPSCVLAGCSRRRGPLQASYIDKSLTKTLRAKRGKPARVVDLGRTVRQGGAAHGWRARGAHHFPPVMRFTLRTRIRIRGRGIVFAPNFSCCSRLSLLTRSST